MFSTFKAKDQSHVLHGVKTELKDGSKSLEFFKLIVEQFGYQGNRVVINETEWNENISLSKNELRDVFLELRDAGVKYEKDSISELKSFSFSSVLNKYHIDYFPFVVTFEFSGDIKIQEIHQLLKAEKEFLALNSTIRRQNNYHKTLIF